MRYIVFSFLIIVLKMSKKAKTEVTREEKNGILKKENKKNS